MYDLLSSDFRVLLVKAVMNDLTPEEQIVITMIRTEHPEIEWVINAFRDSDHVKHELFKLAVREPDNNKQTKLIAKIQRMGDGDRIKLLRELVENTADYNFKRLLSTRQERKFAKLMEEPTGSAWGFLLNIILFRYQNFYLYSFRLVVLMTIAWHTICVLILLLLVWWIRH